MNNLEQDLVRTITPKCMEVLYRLISAGYDIITKYSSVDLLCRMVVSIRHFMLDEMKNRSTMKSQTRTCLTYIQVVAESI